MNYCPSCGSSIALLVPADDTRLRHVCSQCKEVHYRNPRNVVGTIPIWENQVLLCRRAIEPRYGYWTLPAGFLEIGESTEHGAIRETMEEAGAEVEIQSLYSLLNVVPCGAGASLLSSPDANIAICSRHRKSRGCPLY